MNRSEHAVAMDATPLTARQTLLREIDDALGQGASGSDLVELIIRSGWQPRPAPDPNSEYLEGVLDNGRRVPIEIRRSRFSRVG
jgi:hypothetical protein